MGDDIGDGTARLFVGDTDRVPSVAPSAWIAAPAQTTSFCVIFSRLTTASDKKKTVKVLSRL